MCIFASPQRAVSHAAPEPASVFDVTDYTSDSKLQVRPNNLEHYLIRWTQANQLSDQLTITGERGSAGSAVVRLCLESMSQ